MTTGNWKSTIGGAFSAFGTTLMGIGVVPQLAGNPSKTLTVFATVGFACTAVGQFLGHLFAADAKTVQDLSAKIDLTTAAVQTGDTSILKKSDVVKPNV